MGHRGQHTECSLSGRGSSDSDARPPAPRETGGGEAAGILTLGPHIPSCQASAGRVQLLGWAGRMGRPRSIAALWVHLPPVGVGAKEVELRQGPSFAGCRENVLFPRRKHSWPWGIQSTGLAGDSEAGEDTTVMAAATVTTGLSVALQPTWPPALGAWSMQQGTWGVAGPPRKQEHGHLDSSDSRSTIRQLLKKYYFQEQNKTTPRVEERYHLP